MEHKLPPKTMDNSMCKMCVLDLEDELEFVADKREEEEFNAGLRTKEQMEAKVAEEIRVQKQEEKQRTLERTNSQEHVRITLRSEDLDFSN